MRFFDYAKSAIQIFYYGTKNLLSVLSWGKLDPVINAIGDFLFAQQPTQKTIQQSAIISAETQAPITEHIDNEFDSVSLTTQHTVETEVNSSSTVKDQNNEEQAQAETVTLSPIQDPLRALVNTKNNNSKVETEKKISTTLNPPVEKQENKNIFTGITFIEDYNPIPTDYKTLLSMSLTNDFNPGLGNPQQPIQNSQVSPRPHKQ